MRIYRTVATIWVTLISAGLLSAQPASAQDTLVGTWQVVSRSYVRGDSAWTEDPVQEGLYIFTESHYAMQEIRESGPRPLFRADTPDSERLAAFEVFHAHGGSYELVDDRLIVHISIAKGPNTMAGITSEYALQWDGAEVLVIRNAPAEQEVRTTRIRRIG